MSSHLRPKVFVLRVHPNAFKANPDVARVFVPQQGTRPQECIQSNSRNVACPYLRPKVLRVHPNASKATAGHPAAPTSPEMREDGRKRTRKAQIMRESGRFCFAILQLNS